MTRLGFVLNRRWAMYLAIAVLFAVACVLLSRWQWARLDEVKAANALVAENWDRAPVPLTDVLADREQWQRLNTWTPVVLEGEYLEHEQLLVRNRPLNGQPGFDVLTPLRLADGSVFVVDRGWVPTGEAQDEPDAVPAPPPGTVSVVVRLRAGEPTLPGRSAPEGQVATVHLPTIADRIGAPTWVNAYGILESERPAPQDERPIAMQRPPQDEGPHLSYALQWIAFGVMAFIGLGWAVRTEYRLRNADDPRVRRQRERRERRREERGPTDAEIEDSLLDAER